LVFLGEADHFVAELLGFRTLLLRYLIGHEFRWIGEELGVCDGLRTDRYLESGDEEWLRRLPSFGYRQGMRTDRDDSLAGLFGGQDYPSEAMRSAHAELARRLRHEVDDSDRLHWFGMDADNAPGAAYEDVAELLAGGGPTADTLAQGLTRVPGESVTLEVERLGVVLARVDSSRGALTGEIGGNAAAQVRRSLLALREALIFVQDSREAADWAQLGAPMARRESTMVAQARSVIAGLPADQNVVLLGHAAHLSKDWPSARPLDTGPAHLRTPWALNSPATIPVRCYRCGCCTARGATPSH
jgi:erythromycin esterase-like protein